VKRQYYISLADVGHRRERKREFTSVEKESEKNSVNEWRVGATKKERGQQF